MLISDKVGEVYFVNLDKVLASKGVEEEKEEIGKVVIGHQQECKGLLFNENNDVLVTVDTMNRIRISNFPNVFLIKQVILQHKK